jgi:hypothetical protein
MKLRLTVLSVLCMAALAGPARAQVAWDSPTLMAPRPVVGTGIFIMDAHRAGVGVMGTWRGSPQGLGLRLGIVDGRGDGVGVLGGVDMLASLATASSTFPLDISWFAGVGAGYDEWLLLSVPIGLTFGRTFGAPDMRFTPYLAPALLVDAHLGRDGAGESNELQLNLGIDLGFDLAFQPGWALRFGAGLADRSGLAVGIVF